MQSWQSLQGRQAKYAREVSKAESPREASRTGRVCKGGKQSGKRRRGPMLVLFTSVRVAVGYLIVPNMSTRQQAPFIHPFIRFVSRFGLAVNKVLRLVSGGGRAVGWGVGGGGGMLRHLALALCSQPLTCTGVSIQWAGIEKINKV